MSAGTKASSSVAIACRPTSPSAWPRCAGSRPDRRPSACSAVAVEGARARRVRSSKRIAERRDQRADRCRALGEPVEQERQRRRGGRRQRAEAGERHERNVGAAERAQEDLQRAAAAEARVHRLAPGAARRRGRGAGRVPTPRRRPAATTRLAPMPPASRAGAGLGRVQLRRIDVQREPRAAASAAATKRHAGGERQRRRRPRRPGRSAAAAHRRGPGSSPGCAASEPALRSQPSGSARKPASGRRLRSASAAAPDRKPNASSTASISGRAASSARRSTFERDVGAEAGAACASMRASACASGAGQSGALSLPPPAWCHSQRGRERLQVEAQLQAADRGQRARRGRCGSCRSRRSAPR